MKNYELLTIFKPNLDVEEVDKNLAKIEDVVKSYDGSVQSVDKIGRKKLAYDIQKFRDGFFVSQVISIPADKVSDLNRQLRLTDSIIRIMVLDVTNAVAAK